MPNPITEQSITRPLKEILHLCLGAGYWECRPIPKDFALTVLAITKNRPESGYHIQTKSQTGEELDDPVLWAYSFWVIDHEKTMQARNYSERMRNERFVFEANVKLVERKLISVLLLEGDIAHVTAYQYIKKGMKQQMKALGVGKLFTDVSQL